MASLVPTLETSLGVNGAVENNVFLSKQYRSGNSLDVNRPTHAGQ